MTHKNKLAIAFMLNNYRSELTLIESKLNELYALATFGAEEDSEGINKLLVHKALVVNKIKELEAMPPSDSMLSLSKETATKKAFEQYKESLSVIARSARLVSKVVIIKIKSKANAFVDSLMKIMKDLVASFKETLDGVMSATSLDIYKHY